ncbi:MAG TPA: hypothetical protein VL096_07275 [Pirellulaceae bacterium]|nr:hypothetical protein [Pirellulaceae bacterium]
MAILRVLLALFVAWLILADCLLARHSAALPHPSGGIMLGLLLGEAGLVATWFATSRQPWPLRLAISWLTMALLAWPAALYSGPSWRQWVGLLLLFTSGVAVGWKIVQASGWRWCWPGENTPPPQRLLGARQYSLATMLEWLTTAATTLGLASWLALPDKQPLVAATSIVCLALVLPLAMALVLVESRALWARCGFALGLLVTALLAIGINQGQVSTPLFALVLTTELLVALFAALLLAIGGGSLQRTTAATTENAALWREHRSAAVP